MPSDRNPRPGRRRGTRLIAQWSQRPRAMLEHPAWRVLSKAAHLVIDRISLEVRYHAGRGVQGVPVTYEDFEKYGIDRQSIAPAIREAVVLGFVEIIRPGRAGNAEFRRPTLYRLTFEPMRDGGYQESHEWKRVVTTRRVTNADGDSREAEFGEPEDQAALAQAKAIACRARANKQHSGNRNPGGVSPVRSGGVSPPENRRMPGGETHRTRITVETNRTIDSLGREAPRSQGRHHSQSSPSPSLSHSSSLRHSSVDQSSSSDRSQADQTDQIRPRVNRRRPNST
jgi:hypothetical protein